MDREPEELQLLGMFGIYKEAFKTILSLKNIFSKILLILVLPLSAIYLAQIPISDLLFREIMFSEMTLRNFRRNPRMYNHILSQITTEWVMYWLFKAAYFLFVLILSLLTTSAIVYTIACMYTAKEITFKKVMGVVPKVWKRLMVTFLWNFIIILGYMSLFLMIYSACYPVIRNNGNAFLVITILLLILFLIGFVYINVIWHLASVISVLEDTRGLKAMMKSKDLIKGKMWVACAIYLKLHIIFVAIQVAFKLLVVYGLITASIVGRIGYGIVFWSLLTMLILFALVIQTIIYFVCKAYNRENIDKSCLAEHLEVYKGDYVPLMKAKDVQLQKFDV